MATTVATSPPRRRTRASLLGVPLALTAINQRRLANFKANKRAHISLIIFMIMFVLTLFAELIANDKPLLIRHEGSFYFPAFKSYSEDVFLDDGFPTEADYRDPFLSEAIEETGWILWPPIPYSYDTIIYDLPGLRHRRPAFRTGSEPTTRQETSSRG